MYFFSKFVVFSKFFLYWFPARTKHELTIWVALSTSFFQSLHSGDTYWRSMPFFIAFVLKACSWAAHIRLSVSRFSSPPFSDCNLLWSCIPSVSLRNWASNAFSVHAACLSFSHSYHQYLFLVVTLQLQPSGVSRCCLQHNQRDWIFPTQHSLWHSATLYLPELLVSTTCQQKSLGVSLHACSTVFAFVGQSNSTLPYSSWLLQPYTEPLLQPIY